MAARESKEERIRRKILQAINQKINGSFVEIRQSDLHKIAGYTSVRAPYLRALLTRMQEEELIDCHYWQTNSTKRRSCMYWSVYKHPENVKARERREQAAIESERMAPIFAERARQWKAERAAYEAKQRFYRNFEQFLASNYDEIFSVICRIYREYSPKTKWLHSREFISR